MLSVFPEFYELFTLIVLNKLFPGAVLLPHESPHCFWLLFFSLLFNCLSEFLILVATSLRFCIYFLHETLLA